MSTPRTSTPMAGPAGVFRSGRFPRLWLETTAALVGDQAQLRRVLAEGLASPEHTAFVRSLAVAAQVAASPKSKPKTASARRRKASAARPRKS